MDHAQEYWIENEASLSIKPKGNSEIDTRICLELEALAHQIVEFSTNPYEDDLTLVAYAIARALELPNWPAAYEDLDENHVMATEKTDAIIRALKTAAPSKGEDVPGKTWQDMTDYGQVKVGDFISFFIGDQHFDEQVKEVLNAGTDFEELIYNKKQNYYVICKNVLTGFGNVKKFRFFSKGEKQNG